MVLIVERPGFHSQRSPRNAHRLGGELPPRPKKKSECHHTCHHLGHRMFASRLVLHRVLGLTAGVLIGTKLVGKQAQGGLETRPHGSLLISCYPAVYLRGDAKPAVRPPKGNPKCICLPSAAKRCMEATKNKIDRGFLNCWSNHCGNLNERFGHDVGGLVHVTTNVRAKGDVGVGAAAITG